MTSTNVLGTTHITLQFNLSRNIDAAAQDVQAMIAKAGRDLPQDLPAPPTYQKVNPADQPVLYLSLSSPTLPLSDVDEYRRDLDGAAHLHGQRRGAGDGLWRPEVRGAGAARSQEAGGPPDRH